ncbi:malto-oligosyltrehalose trehalohydrolase [Novosphingobium terrae]|uniref:malto-oligosyltrehalose trehalohydrolase n=1 Tax=Novosphingobium terrae TaxID=2726189 RepID=UPI00197D54D3|nr:malto-oligosyltrehalose trehalohydrolase [Novosphingobium terrae]
MRRWGPVALKDSVRFQLWAPARTRLYLLIEGREPAPMQKQTDGWFTLDTKAPPGTRYRFQLEDGTLVPDPASRAQSEGVHGWSVVTDLASRPWQAPDWQGRSWEEAVIQEVHAGLYGGFAGMMRDLPRLAALGVTAIELMPVAAVSGARNWGYDGVLPFAPAEALGTPQELQALVDAAHGLGLMVLLDVVYNHFGPDGHYIPLYAPEFLHAETMTPWGGAVAVDRPEVAAFFLENALQWLEDYRFDGLRFDAVHAIGNSAFLHDLAGQIRKRLQPRRHIHLILENEHNDAALLTPGLYDAQWNDDFHNVLHVLLTGEDAGYYRDFAEKPAEKLARCLSQGFVYQGEPSPHQNGKTRGTSSGHLPPGAFVSFLQNHDQIGNRALGERLTLLTDPERLRAATALLLLCPQIPLFFMGDETGSRSPFLFFTDFHDDLAEIVREGRRREFAHFPAFADKASRARIPDPNALSTFEASIPAPGPDGERWEALYRDLLALRAARIVPRLKGATAQGAETTGERAVRAAWRLNDGAVLTLALDLSNTPALPEAQGQLLRREGPRFGAWLAPA